MAGVTMTSPLSRRTKSWGTTIDMDGNHIIVGAYLRDIGSPGDDGAAYIFGNDAGVWTEKAYIYDAFNQPGEHFGNAVAISGDFAMAGSPEDQEDENEENELGGAGAIFVFDVNEPNTLLSVNDNRLEANIKAYPNPVNDILNIKLSTYYKNIQLNLFNSLGQLVHTDFYKNTNELQLNLNVSKGLYFVELKIDNQVSTFRIVKH